MQSNGRRRRVSSCIPCYKKKQKCNRRYPCDHCTRRRQPEQCVYHQLQASQAPIAENRQAEDTLPNHDTQSLGTADNDEPISPLLNRSRKMKSTVVFESDSLTELFGYVEHSNSNTMALVRRLGLNEDDQQNRNRGIPPENLDEIEENIGRLPGREIFDFLVQYYVTEVHWMEQVVYTPWFLVQYQKWWALERLELVFDVEFAVLFLRICAYASQFLPSPSYTIDRIRGMPLADIRDACHSIAEKLTSICERLDARGTLLRVQHLSILGLQWQCEGRMNAFWEALSKTILVAQRIGLHRGRTAWKSGMHEFDKEIRCRVFCNIYIWDSYLSRHLDCNPFIASSLTSDHLPRMHLSHDIDDASAPEDYLERLMQARLASFWRSLTPRQGAEYEEMVAEERYEKFCSEFLMHLPPVFALEPSEKWDERLQKLPLQRQVLHIAIFYSLCHNFRSVLLREPAQVQSLPAYKQVLVASQRRTLAAAALKMLDGVSKLHALLGRSHTRFAAIILPTFETAVILVSLTMDAHFPGNTMGDNRPLHTLNADPLGWEKAHMTRERCLRAVQEAQARLEMLAEVSNMAKISARTVAHSMAKMLSTTSNGDSSGDGAQAALLGLDNLCGGGDVDMGQTTLVDLDHFFSTYSADTFPGLNVELPD